MSNLRHNLIAIKKLTKQISLGLVWFIFMLSMIVMTFNYNTAPAHASFNQQINYQGKLMTSAGVNVTDGTYHMRFKLCPDINCASSVFDETWTSSDKITVTSGLFSVLLGSVSTTAMSTIDFNQDLYLQVTVGGSGVTPTWETLSPAKRLGAVPNAFNAQKFDGMSTTSFLRADAFNLSGYFGSLSSTNATFTSLTSTNLFANNISSSQATSTNLFASIFNAIDATISNIINIATAIITNLTATTANITNLVLGNATGTSMTLGNITATSSATLATTSITSLSVSNLTGLIQATNGTISTTSTISNSYLNTNVMLEGDNISLLNNNAGYLTSESDPIWLAASSSYLTVATATANFLTISSAASTYLTQANAASTYTTQASSTATYLTIANAASTYLTSSNAASTYLSLTDWYTTSTQYLTTTTASSTYLRIIDAANTYQPIGSYLTTSTGLTVANFASPNISQWTNDSNYLTTYSSSTAIAVFSSVSSTALQVNGNATTTGTLYTGNLTVGTLTGVLQANNGILSVTSTISSNYLSSNVILEGESISLLSNDSGYLTTYNSSTAIAVFDSVSSTNVTTTNLFVTGLATPAGAFLAVNGSGQIIVTSTPTGSSQWTTLGSNIYYTAGYVGIGTTTPAASLDVYGNANFGNGVGDESLLTYSIAGTAKMAVGYSSTSDNFVVSTGTALSANQIFVINRTTGNVGIGTASPNTKLEVAGTVSSTALQVNGNATTTNLVVTSITNSWLSTNASGLVVATTAPQEFITAGTVNDYYRGDKTWAATSTLRLTKSQITDFGTYENPLTFTYPLQRTVDAISLAFGTTTSNTWAGTQTFGTVSSTALQVNGNATTTGNLSIGNLTINSENFTDLTGTGLVNTAGALTHSTANGYSHIPATGASTQILQYTSAGTAKWITLSGQASIADGGALTVSDMTCTDCINATEIEDIYVLNTSDTMSGSLAVGTTFSAGTSTLTNLIVTNLTTSTFAGGLTVGSTNLVVQQATGYVGMGTASPVNNLTIDGTGVTLENNNPLYWNGYYSGGFKYWKSTSSAYINQETNGDIVVKTAPAGIAGNTPTWTTRFLIQNTTGNIGIGTSTPDSLFQVGNATQYFKVSSAGNVTTTGYLSVGSTALTGANFGAGDLNVKDQLVVGTSLTAGGTIVDADGVDFTSTGGTIVGLAGSVTIMPGLYSGVVQINDGNNALTYTSDLQFDVSTLPPSISSIKSSSIGINDDLIVTGNVTTTGGFYVGGTSRFIGRVIMGSSTYATTSDKYSLILPSSGVNTGYGIAVGWDTFSDSRIKDNQQPLNYGLKELLQLTPKRYLQRSSEFKNGQLVLGDGAEKIGLIAQEVYGIVPEAVTMPKDQSQELWTMNYDSLIPVIIKSIQELATQTETLKSQTTSNSSSTSTDPAIVVNDNSSSGDVVVRNVIVNGWLNIEGDTTFYKSITVIGDAGFKSKVTFEKEVEFKDHVSFDQDTAGTVIVIAGVTSTEVVFGRPYEMIPRIVANLSEGNENTFANYKIIKKSTSSFTILLQNTVAEDLTFDWIALASKDREGQVAGAQAIAGCMDSTATNYNSSATESDGSCTYETATPPASSPPTEPAPTEPSPVEPPPTEPSPATPPTEAPAPPAPVLGCMDSIATNYDPLATQDNGTCTYEPVAPVSAPPVEPPPSEPVPTEPTPVEPPPTEPPTTP